MSTYKNIYLLILLILSSISVFAQLSFPGTVIAQSAKPTSVYHFSPSITIMNDGSYIASHDWGGKELGATYSSIYRSTDQGET